MMVFDWRERLKEQGNFAPQPNSGAFSRQGRTNPWGQWGGQDTTIAEGRPQTIPVAQWEYLINNYITTFGLDRVAAINRIKQELLTPGGPTPTTQEPHYWRDTGAGNRVGTTTPTTPTEPVPTEPYDPKYLAQFLTPARQYWARMGPTAQQQYYGYEQARTGALPEETDWRLWSSAPPTGSYRGLTFRR